MLRRISPQGEVWYAIYEVYYDENGVPTSCSSDPISAFGEDETELKRDLSMMIDGCGKPVLDYDYFERRSRSPGVDSFLDDGK